MSVVGFDFGNESCVVAVARKREIDVVLDEDSNHQIPAIVCFGERQRFIGTAGAESAMMNPKSTVSQIKRLIGRPFSDPEMQKDLKSLPFTVTEGSDGFPLINVRYLEETTQFTPTQVLGMLFSDLKGIAEKNLNAVVKDCCIGIPVYFTDLQRRAVLEAATIAGLHPLRLIHETTATALSYGIYKTDLPENNTINVAFVDVGHSSLQVCIAGFKKGQLKILAHSFDRSLGGRDFDEALFRHFAAKFKEEYKIDVYQNARACLRLRAGCEKLKKVLSANPEAPLNIECLMDEKDVRGFIKREEFENISIPVLERVKKPLEKALAEAGLTSENIHAVEVVGSSSRIPSILKILTDFFGKEPQRTLNASECVAKACALECAILSPTFKVKDFQVNERFPFPISLSWKGQNGAADDQQSTIVIPKGTSIPCLKAVTILRLDTLTVDLHYADVSELQAPAKISSYTITPFQSAKGDRAKLKIKVRLNLHGVVTVDSALLLDKEETEVSAVKEAIKMDTDAKTDASRKKVKKVHVPVSETVYGGLSSSDLQKAVEKEFEMALQDRMEETKDRKNAVEAYVYDMRNKLNNKYHDFVTPTQKDQFIASLREVEDWLYEDGEDETKSVYVAKLEDLKKQADPIEERFKEHTEHGTVIGQFNDCVNSFRDAVISNDPKFDHIDVSEKQKVLSSCVQAQAWLREKKQQQDALPKYATPVLKSADVKKRAEEVDRLCRPLMTKPKPDRPKPTTLEPQHSHGAGLFVNSGNRNSLANRDRLTNSVVTTSYRDQDRFVDEWNKSGSESDSEQLQSSQPTLDVRSFPRSTSRVESDSEHYDDEGGREADVDADDVLMMKRGKAAKFTRYSDGLSTTTPKKENQDDSWQIHTSCHGGPVDPSVIPSFGGHILFAICNDSSKDRGVMGHYSRALKLVDFTEDWKLGGEIKKKVDASGLSHLSRCMISNLNMPLLSAFIERWQPDTNTFHLPFGEITILLHDVQQILGISIDGDMCGVPGDPLNSLCVFLRRNAEEIHFPYMEGLPIYKNGAVLPEAVMDIADDGSVEDQVQAYLALLLGMTLFVDKSMDRIGVHLFPLLDKGDKVCDYAWGAGALAYLYRQLGVATRVGSRGVAGCLTLLQAWIYEYFPTFRPHAAVILSPGQPRVLSWMNDLELQPKKEALAAYRVRLDHLTSSSVSWQPYGLMKYSRTSLYTGILRFMEIMEPYQANRCLRQFGYVQVIPTRMMQPARCSRPASGLAYTVDHGTCDQLWIGRETHMVVPSHVSRRISNETSDVHARYMEWFLSVSHPFFVHPVKQPHAEASLDVHAGYETGCALARRILPVYALNSDEDIAAWFHNARGEILSLATQLVRHAPGRGERGGPASGS